MSNEVERIKKMITKDMLVDAVELPLNHQKSDLSKDVEDVLSNFDDDFNYAHFVVRVKRGDKPIVVNEEQEDNVEFADFSIQKLVDETFEDHENRATNNQEGHPIDFQETVQSDEPTNYAPHELLENAVLLEQNKEYKLARTIYRNLIKSGNYVPQALVGSAKCLEGEEKFGEAIRYYEEAIAYAPEVATYQSLSALLIKTGRDSQASEVITRALTLAGLNDIQKFEFHKSLGNCYTRLSKNDKAEEQYWLAYELNSDSDALQVNVGTLALQKNDYDAAEKHFERALDLNMRNDKAISGLGMIAMMKGDLKAAQDCFVRALSMNPDNLGAIFNLVKTAYELKSFKDAAYFLRNYISNHEPNINILYSYVGVLYHQEEYTLALNEVKRILELNPNHVGAKELADLIENKLRA